MAVVKKVNIFAIIMLIMIAVLIVFLAFCAVYFFNVSSGVLPSNSQTMFMAWIAIVILIILAILMVYAFMVTLKGDKEYVPKNKPPKGTKLKPVEKPQIATVNMNAVPTTKPETLAQPDYVYGAFKNNTVKTIETAENELGGIGLSSTYE